MTCTPCEQRRAALRAAQLDADAHAREAFKSAAPTLGSSKDALLRYILSLPIKVKGKSTGREYRFDDKESLQRVDPRDVDELLASRIFRRVS